MKKLPCIDCICLAICRAKLLSEVMKCENVVEFLARPAPPDPDPVRGALLSDGKYVRSTDWDRVCEYLHKQEHRIHKENTGDGK